MDAAVIVLLGDRPPAELRDLALRKPLTVEVHDRTAKPEHSTFKLVSPGAKGAGSVA